MLNSDFKEFAGSFHSTQVDYLIVASYTLAAFGHPRYTSDLNFISIEDFKTNKRNTGCLKDLADLEALG